MPTTETPKTETPRTESPFAAFQTFDPMSMWAAGQQAFTKMMAEATDRWQSFSEQFATMEQQMSTQAHGAVTHFAQLAKEAITYGAQLATEARKLSLETAKKMGVGA